MAQPLTDLPRSIGHRRSIERGDTNPATMPLPEASPPADLARALGAISGLRTMKRAVETENKRLRIRVEHERTAKREAWRTADERLELLSREHERTESLQASAAKWRESFENEESENGELRALLRIALRKLDEAKGSPSPPECEACRGVGRALVATPGFSMVDPSNDDDPGVYADHDCDECYGSGFDLSGPEWSE